MDFVIEELPDDVLLHILKKLDDATLKTLGTIFPRISNLQENSQLWLAIIKERHNLKFSIKQAFSLLEDMLNANLASKINVEFLDEEENEIISLGTVLVSASYTLNELVNKIIKKFGLRGWMEFTESIQFDLTKPRYRQYEITYDSYYAENYVKFNFQQLIIPPGVSEDDLGKLKLWLDSFICDIMPKPLLLDLVILIHKHSYSKKEKAIIMQALE